MESVIRSSQKAIDLRLDFQKAYYADDSELTRATMEALFDLDPTNLVALGIRRNRYRFFAASPEILERGHRFVMIPSFRTPKYAAIAPDFLLPPPVVPPGAPAPRSMEKFSMDHLAQHLRYMPADAIQSYGQRFAVDRVSAALFLKEDRLGGLPWVELFANGQAVFLATMCSLAIYRVMVAYVNRPTLRIFAASTGAGILFWIPLRNLLAPVLLQRVVSTGTASSLSSVACEDCMCRFAEALDDRPDAVIPAASIYSRVTPQSLQRLFYVAAVDYKGVRCGVHDVVRTAAKDAERLAKKQPPQWVKLSMQWLQRQLYG
eukprot:TRINITY_DN45137_c0_g1_i1.p2 TRINITY_DN45137_c0_g1~~TRINITY_DN45137_c0_g1_i1.p2  ORF type:complete len:318 (+),score=71.23 TRINITY_DN45137_c0_g1_i1:214-1167(+)